MTCYKVQDGATLPALKKSYNERVGELESCFADILKFKNEFEDLIEKIHHLGDEVMKVFRVV